MHLDQSEGRYEYLLVVVDHFNKFVQASATKISLGELLLIYCLINIFFGFGFPKRILHDQRKEFDNKLFKRLSEITGVKPSRKTP